MPSTFVGIETAFRGLQAQQKALNITGHNIANANTDGYSRQSAVISSTEPYAFPDLYRSTSAGQMGTGAEVSAIMRLRDSFMDSQVQQETQSLGRWQAREQNLEQLQLILYSDSKDNGIDNAFTKFWTALQDLVNRPEDPSVRTVVQEQASNLTDTFRHVYGEIKALQSDLNDELQIKVNDVNSLASQIADLNDQIGKVTALGDQPNDLLDQREVLVQKLANLTNIEISVDHMNRYNITISGRSLVTGDQVSKIYVESNVDRDGLYDVKWEDNDENVQFRNGGILGVLEIRDDDIETYKSKLNELASTFINQMNEVHQAGYGLDGSTNVPFFTGDSAENIAVSQQILLDPRSIAASKTLEAGLGDNASEMAALMQKQTLTGGTATFNSFYTAMISKLGVDTAKAKTMGENQDELVKSLQDRQESVAGVSLDEEMANMVKFQNAYNAAARILTTMNEMLDTLINRMGV